MAKIKVDLHNVFNNSKSIEYLLVQALNDAVEKNIKIIEIIPGKGSGQLKKHVLRFLQQPQIKKMYKRVDKDSKNFGKLLVRF
jgi:dsDNA-specific endonuclease/ATPase MutS2